MRAKWIAFLCWFLDHRMKLTHEWVNWGLIERRFICGRCGGNETWERIT